MQTFYIGNSLLSDELAITLISDILTCFAADVGLGLLDRAPLVIEAPHRGALQHCYIDIPVISYSKDRAPLPPLAEEAPNPSA